MGIITHACHSLIVMFAMCVDILNLLLEERLIRAVHMNPFLRPRMLGDISSDRRVSIWEACSVADCVHEEVQLSFL
jgi:hypothetical protein